MLVDDHAMVREAVAAIIDATPDLSVDAQAASLATARLALHRTMIHVGVIDVSLPDGNGLTLVCSMRSVSPSVGLVVLTMHDDERTIRASKDAGASALVFKTGTASDVVAAVRTAVRHPASFAGHGLGDRLDPLPNAQVNPLHLPRAGGAHPAGERVLDRCRRVEPLHERVHRQDPHGTAVLQTQRPQQGRGRHGRRAARARPRRVSKPAHRPVTRAPVSLRPTRRKPLAARRGLSRFRASTSTRPGVPGAWPDFGHFVSA